LHTGNSTGAPWRISNVPSAFQGTSGTTSEYIASATCTANEWTYLSGSYNSNGAAPTADLAGAANVRLFKNDTLSGAANTTGSVNQVSVGTAASVFIGRLQSTDRFMRGGIDEVRVSNVQRSADWNKLEYENQKAGSAVVSEVVPITNIYYVIPGVVNAPRDTMVYQTGVAVNLALNYTGGPADSIALTTGTLPAGLTLNKATGAITGTPTAITAAASQTITVYSIGGNVTRGLRTSVVAGPLGNLTYSPDTTTYAMGIPVTNAPTYTGRAPTAFTVTPALPAGLTINATTGVISGTPTAQTAAANYTVRATNTAGPDTTTKVLRLTIGAAENYATGWSQHRDWWLNTQLNGASIPTATYNFPVLVRLDSNSINFAQTTGGGRDLRFSKADNATRLPHQIDTWDSAGKRAAVWVLVDTVPALGVKALRMHWGNASAANTSSGSAVFRTTDGYQGVWHMNGATDTSNEPDATANNLTANQTSGPVAVAGIVGGARNFVNTTTTATDYFTVAGSAAPLNFPIGGPFTLSAWVNLTGTTAHATLISKHDNAYALKLDNGSNWEIFDYDASWNSVGGPPTAGVWQNIMGVYSTIDPAFYIDGSRVDFGIVTTGGTAARSTGIDMLLGAEPTSATARRRPYNGMADEIRVANVARTADWAKLEYQNQRPTGQTLVAFTLPVAVDGMVARTEAFGFTAKPFGNGVVFQIQGAGAGKARVSLMDMWGRTVWSHTAATAAGMNQVLWNGQANNGSLVSSGVYVVRVSLLDAANKVTATSERRIPLTR
jgi:hypothetical protein